MDRISNGYFKLRRPRAAAIEYKSCLPGLKQQTHNNATTITYHAALLTRPILLILLQVLDDGHLHLGIIVLVSVSLVRHALLRHLLVVHGVLRLVD